MAPTEWVIGEGTQLPAYTHTHTHTTHAPRVYLRAHTHKHTLAALTGSPVNPKALFTCGLGCQKICLCPNNSHLHQPEPKRMPTNIPQINFSRNLDPVGLPSCWPCNPFPFSETLRFHTIPFQAAPVLHSARPIPQGWSPGLPGLSHSRETSSPPHAEK